jgi:uncharacterized protein (TIGR03067 family)
VEEASFRLNADGRPREIDMDFGEWARTRAIYELKGDRLRLCWSKLGGPPAGFDTRDGDMLTFVWTYEKQK